MGFKRHIIILLSIVGLISCTSDDDLPVLKVRTFPDRTGDFSLWQLDQFYGEVQMGYIIKTDDGKVIIIDGGLPIGAPILKGFIGQLGGKVDSWVLTHPHEDHVGAFLSILNEGKIKIDQVVHSRIEEEWVRQNELNYYEYVKSYHKSLENSSTMVVDPTIGEEILLGDGVSMKILGGWNENIRVNALNNASLVFKVKSAAKSVLFTGDLGIEGGQQVMLQNSLDELKADYVQMAHHGQAGANRDFYATVGAQYALWPTPEWLWNNNLEAKGYNTGTWKTLAVRQWMDELNIQKNYVAGIEGTVQID